ncbi:NAD(P)-dependent oxidoreductase [Sorangium sp. So ce1078]|uniref:NAD(P)-dependent oxidoreductase n=1 Tax=Sorangium sp. So ce1078 TaxID=3133329 RepID=UPI003F5F9C70
MNIGIFGARGTLGQRIVAEALGRGHAITAFARDPSRIPAERGAVRWQVADVLSAESIAAVLDGLDVLVNAYGPGPSSNAEGRYSPEDVEAAVRRADSLLTAARALLRALEKRPALRLIVVGGAGSLEVAPGLQGVDTGPDLVTALQEIGLPEAYKEVILAHRDALNLYRVSNRNWTYFSPAHITVPGERTGRFRLGGNQLVVGADGQSRISCEDYAMALVDELELPRHVQQRFTIGY